MAKTGPRLLRSLKGQFEIKGIWWPSRRLHRLPYIQSIPVAGPIDTTIQSGHAYTTKNTTTPKTKPKTKGVAADTDRGEQSPEIINNDQSLASLPVALPTSYKLGKRHLKVMDLSSALMWVVSSNRPIIDSSPNIGRRC